MSGIHPKIRVKWFLWLSGICCLLVFWLLLSAQSGPSPYRRFTSQPLPDGSRYTFLYPAYLKDVQENGQGASAGVTQNVSIYNRQVNYSSWERLHRWLGRPVAEPMESVSVLVVPQKQSVIENRQSEGWERGLVRRHNEYLTDSRTRAQFLLMYSCPRNAPAQFERNHLTIVQSLQVLPPTP